MLNIGIIGAGRIGKVHLESISYHVKNATVTAMADPFMNEETEKLIRSYGVSKVTKDAPPFLIIHGTDDHTVPFEKSEILYEKLTKNGCDVKFIELEGADHADMQFFQDELWNRIIEFFDEKLK